MAKRPRNADALEAEGAALWRRVVATVAPLPGRAAIPVLPPVRQKPSGIVTIAAPVALGKRVTPVAVPSAGGTLDGSWDRRLGRGLVQPDRSVDLHGLTLDRAYATVDAALDAAIRRGERVVLMVAGKARPDTRGTQASGSNASRGAIRAVIRDWLAASRHAGAIAAVRNAHPRHGGAGALYIVLRRR